MKQVVIELEGRRRLLDLKPNAEKVTVGFFTSGSGLTMEKAVFRPSGETVVDDCTTLPVWKSDSRDSSD